MPVIIPKELMSMLRTSGELEYHPVKSKVFTQGEEASHFFIVAKGRVRVFTISPNGDERTIEILESGRIFGDSSFLSGSRRAVTIEAVTPSEIISYRVEELVSMCAKSEQLMRLVFQHMAETCNYLTVQIIQNGYYNSTQKVAAFLLNESENRNISSLPYTHDEIAASVSLNRVTVSRVVMELKNKGFIDTKYGEIKICSPTGLKQLLPGS